jgi:hypothetical protein
MPFSANSEGQIGVLPKMSPASSEISASFTRNGFAGCRNISRSVGLVTRKMNQLKARGPCAMAFSKRRRSRTAARGPAASVACTTSTASKALCIARKKPDENIGSMKV